ncbi:MAG: hypothetical protein ACKVS9_00335 [Phycisphaerae bacterium]
MKIRARYDGKTIVPDEPLDLPADTALDVEVYPAAIPVDAPASPEVIAARLEALKSLCGWVSVGSLPERMSRSDNCYDERE